MKVTIFQNIFSKDPYIISIDKVFERIKTGNSRDIVNKIRGSWVKEDRLELKKTLPSICFSGEFTKRANDSCTKHSGIVCLDFDHLDKVNDFKDHLTKDKYIFSAFISPSGDGLKVLIKVPANIETHKASCKALKEYFKTEKLDSFEDIARVCFESYDPDIYINKESAIFTDLIIDGVKEVHKQVIQTNSTDIFNKLKTWIEKTESYHDGNKHKFLVKFAGALNRFGVNPFESINLLSSHYQNAASHVKYKDFEDIVNRTYKTYRNQYNTDYFEVDGIAYERSTKKKTSNEFFNEYKPISDDVLKHAYSHAKIDFELEYKMPEFFIRIKNEIKWLPICSFGNFSCFTGKSKARKSFARYFLEAGCIGNKTIDDKFIIRLPENKRNIIYFDTEQGKHNVVMAAHKIVKMAGVSNIDNYQVWALREYSYLERCKIIEQVIEQTQNLGVVFIDGIADLAFGNNDEVEANRVVQLLMNWTAKYDIHINTIIHQTKSNDWATGHLGSAIEKKAESVINIKKEGNYSIFEAKQLRNCEDFAPFPFIINANGIPELITDKTIIDEITEDEF